MSSIIYSFFKRSDDMTQQADRSKNSRINVTTPNGQLSRRRRRRHQQQQQQKQQQVIENDDEMTHVNNDNNNINDETKSQRPISSSSSSPLKTIRFRRLIFYFLIVTITSLSLDWNHIMSTSNALSTSFPSYMKKIKSYVQAAALSTQMGNKLTTTMATALSTASSSLTATILDHDDYDDDDMTTSEEIEIYHPPPPGTTPAMPTSSSPPPLPPSSAEGSSNNNGNVIVAATVGGDIVAICAKTGVLLWKRKGLSSSLTNKNENNVDDDDEEEGDDQGEVRERLFTPLVTTSTTTRGGGGGRHRDWRTAAIPSIDGLVHLTHNPLHNPHPQQSSTTSSSSSSAHTTTLPVSSLVSRSPFVDPSGRFYVGSRSSMAVAFDRTSGRVLRHLSNAAGEFFSPEKVVDGREVVWMGRVDDAVTIYDARTGEVDVTFSTGKILSVAEMLGSGGGSGNDGARVVEGEEEEEEEEDRKLISSGSSSSEGESSTTCRGDDDDEECRKESDDDDDDDNDDKNNNDKNNKQQPSVLISTPSGTLALRNPLTGHIEWISPVKFSTPVAYALSATSGKSLPVSMLPDGTHLPSASKLEWEQQLTVYEEMEQQQQQTPRRKMSPPSRTRSKRDDNAAAAAVTTVVEALTNGQIYAMPLLTRRMTSTTTPSSTEINYDNPNDSSGKTAPLTTTTTTTRMTLPAVFGKHHSSLHHEWMTMMTTPASSSSPTTTSSSSSSSNSNNHPTSSENQMILAKCTPLSPGFPSCLVGQQSSSFFTPYTKENTEQSNNFLHSLSQNSDDNDDTYDDENIAVLSSHHHQQHRIDYLSFLKEYVKNKQRFKKKKSWFQTFIRIMTSWIPPAVALAFVVSFEVGRRERLKSETNMISWTGGGRSPDNNYHHQTERSSSDAASSAAAARQSSNISSSESLKNNKSPLISLTDEVLGYGGHGTVVYKGYLSGRQVAVKRLLQAYHASADREIELLIESDGHPNVVRYFLKETRGDFVYLALELCDLSLHDLISCLRSYNSTTAAAATDNGDYGDDDDGDAEEKRRLLLAKATKSCLYQIAQGVRHLHRLRIVHRDLKPQNILLARKNQSLEKDPTTTTTTNPTTTNPTIIFQNDDYVPKISDMGLGKQLAHQSSFGVSTTLGVPHKTNNNIHQNGYSSSNNRDTKGAGSVGWQAPEVMSLLCTHDIISSPSQQQHHPDNNDDDDDDDKNFSPESPLFTTSDRTSRSVDVFSLGCVFYCTLLPGYHPFGEWYEREANVMKNNPDISALAESSCYYGDDATHLISTMISRDPKMRPTSKEVCDHPFFWGGDKRLSFLSEFSDRVEAEEKKMKEGAANGSGGGGGVYIVDVWNVERDAKEVVGLAWDSLLDPEVLANVNKFRNYDNTSIRDCLRIIRNKYHHYDELPEDCKRIVGSNPEGLSFYFEEKFPKLIMHCFNVCVENLTEDDPLAKKYCIPQKKIGFNAYFRKQQQAAIMKGKKTVPLPVDGDYLLQSNVDLVAADDPAVGSDNYVDKTHDDDDKPSLFSKMVDLIDDDDLDDVSQSAPHHPSLSSSHVPDPQCLSTTSSPQQQQPPSSSPNSISTPPINNNPSIIIWSSSNAAKFYQCRGWLNTHLTFTSPPSPLLKSTFTKKFHKTLANDPKYRTRLCNHWDNSRGTRCPIRNKKKCVFAHGPVELRVKEGKRKRWGTLVDKKGNNSNPWHSGGEDTYGAAKGIEINRKVAGKWNTDKTIGGGAAVNAASKKGVVKQNNNSKGS